MRFMLYGLCPILDVLCLTVYGIRYTLCVELYTLRAICYMLYVMC